jgi:pyridoxal phosphate enzyme (YggS family)
MDIERNIEAIRQRVQAALNAAGRASDEVTIIGVTKGVEPERIQSAMSLGLTDLGENRVQELMAKHDKLPGARWHIIGRLQRNKVKYIIDKAAVIHSLDSLPLAREINRHAERIQRVMPVLVQVNAANEETKAGLPCEEVLPFIETVFNLKYIKVMGLMMIAPLSEDPELVRPYFRIMKQLYDELISNNYPHTDIRYLSMGMSNDFETAIEEGSNMVRIGTALFGRREKGEAMWQENS